LLDFRSGHPDRAQLEGCLMKRTFRTGMVAGLLALALTGAACGSGSSSSDAKGNDKTSEQGGAVQTPDTAAPAPQPAAEAPAATETSAPAATVPAKPAAPKVTATTAKPATTTTTKPKPVEK